MKVHDPAHKATSLAIGWTIAGKADNMFSDIYNQTKKKVKDKPCTLPSGKDHDGQRERSVNLHYNQTLQYCPSWPPQYYQAPP